MRRTGKLWILGGSDPYEGAFRDPRLFFVLSGRAEFTLDGGALSMKEGGYLAVNGREFCRAEVSPDGLLGLLELSADTCGPYLETERYRIHASSDTDSPEVREKISGLLKRLFGYYEMREADESMLVESVVLELLYVLKQHSMTGKKLSVVTKKRDDRSVRNELLSYLHFHYMEQVTLSDLAGLTYFTETYLSRYIRKQFGKTFSALLTDIRLEHALRAIEETDEKIIRIAMESGFPSTVSFNREFRRRFSMTPSEYRVKKRETGEKQKSGEDAAYPKESPELKERIHTYMERHGTYLRGAKGNEQTLFAVNGRNRLLKRFWSDMVNAGLARDLLRADMQEHLTEIREGLGIRYVRFWDIWSPELMVYDGNPDHGYSFTRLDAVIAYLYNHRMYPHIEMGFKPVQLSRSVLSSVLFEERMSPFESGDVFCGFLESFLRHYMHLYGEEYVEKWRIELWMNPGSEEIGDYLELFAKCRQTAKGLLPQIEIGGAGFSREYGNLFEELARNWGRRYSRPDFVSVYLFPFDNGFLDPDGKNAVFYRGEDYVPRFLQKVQKILRDNNLGQAKLYVTEWNSTFASRDPLNDSIYKGAYVVRSLLQMIGKVDAAGYWFASDLYSSYYDSGQLLDGSGGLLSRDGICKPSYYGLDFFNRLGNFFLAADGNGIITSDGNGRYRIVCHNYIHPDAKYFDFYRDLREDNYPEWDEEYYSGTERRFRFVIEGVPDGRYIAKTRILDSEHGSVEDEWKRMGRSDVLDRRDVEYLRRICVPQILISTVEAERGLLELELKLPPNGIGSIHIFPAGE